MYQCYAQLDSENICIGISRLSNIVTKPSLVLLQEMDVSLIGFKFNNGTWEKVTETILIPTDTQLLMQAQADAELRDFQIQQGQELLAQQMADIELAVLGGAV